ncbi:glycosyltransferase [Mumia sp. zg.B17]|uniref:glycosyltransferase n=1 Tax=Mumia sp. zg.B17 TaxID=2855446 RepID=UPI001C6EBA17|nr:glycosyltransferase [Mumia sp. zg.B17]MBW9204513.1 glycosyltransferase [Mumia sp. zg.B17]
MTVEIHVDERAALGRAAAGVCGAQMALEVTLTIAGWAPPRPGWTGRLGHLPHLAELSVQISQGEAHVAVRTSEPVAVAEVIRAVEPLFYPEVQRTTPLSARVVLSGAVGDDPDIQAWSGQFVAPMAAVEPEGSNMVPNDVAVAASADDVEPIQATAHVVRAEEAAWLDSRGRPIARIDPRVHHPIDRIDGAGVDAVAWGTEAGLVVERPKGRRRELAWHAPIAAGDVAYLRSLASLDLSDLQVPPTVGLNASARLAEVAATGVLLHSGRDLHRGGGLVDPVVDLFRAPLAERTVIERTLRSVRQRRLVIREHGILPRPAAGGMLDLSRPPTVTAIMATRRGERARDVVRQLARQSYPCLEVIVACHGVAPPDLSDTAGIEVHVVEASAGATLGEVLAAATRRASGELITKVDDDDFYGPDHVWDLVIGRHYSGGTLVAKQHEFTYVENLDVTIRRPLRGERYVEAAAGGTLMISRADLGAVGGWRPLPRGVDRGLILEVIRSGGLMYVTASVGFVYARHSHGHTWAKPDAHFLTSATDQWAGLYAPALGTPTARRGGY